MCENQRYHGVYRCRKCKTFWSSNNSYEDQGQECRKCKSEVLPHKLKPLKVKGNEGHSPDNCRNCRVFGDNCDNFKKNDRYFGEYRCYKCSRLWMSSNSWLGYGQACKKCHIMVKPLKLRPLEKPEGLDSKIDRKRRHPEHLCGKCVTIGAYCRDYN